MHSPNKNPHPAKKRLGQRATSAIFFSYAFIVGTSAPVFLSRCSANCLGCGSCALILGIVPLTLVIAMRSRLSRLFKQFASEFRRLSRNGKPKNRGPSRQRKWIRLQVFYKR